MDLVGVKNLGETQDENDRNFKFIYEFIINKFGFLTIEEIKEAFRMYVAKEFEIKVFRILDCILIAEVLDNYINFRNEKLRSYEPKNKIKPQLEIITNSKKSEIVEEGVNRAYSEYCKSPKNLQDNIEYIFDYLAESGKIKLASKDTPKLLKYYSEKTEQAKQELLSEKNQEMKLAKKAMNTSMINILKDAVDEISSGSSKKLFLRTKRLVLIDYFNKCILDGKTNIF